MKFFFRLVLWAFLPMSGINARTPLEWAHQAQGMLGPGAWSRIVRIENSAPKSSHARTVDALVFEEGGLLWFYTSNEGTQSLSLYRDRLTEEKADLSPLLREIDAGFTTFSFMPDETQAGLLKPKPLPNGCFIECVAALRNRVLRGERIERPRLLSCYAQTDEGLRGHTVLTYATTQGFYLLDPTVSSRPHAVPGSLASFPEALAKIALPGAGITKARWVPMANPTPAFVAESSSRSVSKAHAVPRVMR
ncbi:MAG: hypothetical protein JWM32_2212 [Verrucomicrobia bacterium]|nr:hypothetical protein [Verrucomicrobiota bacterium]